MVGSSVALVGFHPDTIDLHKDTPADEIWTINWGYREDKGLIRIDRLFEIHPIWLLQSNAYDYAEHVKYLMNEPREYPVYMQHQMPGMPKAITYPLKEVQEEIFSHWYRGDEHANLMTSSFDFMMALAILEKKSPIYIYGFEMSALSDYIQQSAGAAHKIGFANGRGLEVIMPKDSKMLDYKMYGYDNFGMIGRPNLEKLKGAYHGKRDDYLGRHNVLSGQIELLEQTGQEVPEQMVEDLKSFWSFVHIYDGAIQVCERLISECELMTPNPALQKRITWLDTKDVELGPESEADNVEDILR